MGAWMKMVGIIYSCSWREPVFNLTEIRGETVFTRGLMYSGNITPPSAPHSSHHQRLKHFVCSGSLSTFTPFTTFTFQCAWVGGRCKITCNINPLFINICLCYYEGFLKDSDQVRLTTWVGEPIWSQIPHFKLIELLPPERSNEGNRWIGEFKFCWRFFGVFFLHM